MPQPPNTSRLIQFTLSGWIGVAGALAVFAAVAVALVFLAVGLLVFLLPALLVAPVLYYFWHKPGITPMGDNAKPGTRGAIIEGDFRVLSTDKADDKNEAASSD
jgi:hypothetical protein